MASFTKARMTKIKLLCPSTNQVEPFDGTLCRHLRNTTALQPPSSLRLDCSCGCKALYLSIPPLWTHQPPAGLFLEEGQPRCASKALSKHSAPPPPLPLLPICSPDGYLALMLFRGDTGLTSVSPKLVRWRVLRWNDLVISGMVRLEHSECKAYTWKRTYDMEVLHVRLSSLAPYEGGHCPSLDQMGECLGAPAHAAFYAHQAHRGTTTGTGGVEIVGAFDSAQVRT